MPLVDPVTMSAAASASSTPARRRRGGAKKNAASASTTDAGLADSTTSPSTSSPASVPTKAPTAAAAAPSPSGAPPPSAVALVARNASPAILLAALAWSFDGLIAAPPSPDSPAAAAAAASGAESPEQPADLGVTTLAILLGIATVVQVASAAVGLPPAGSDSDATKKRKARKDYRKPNVIVTTFLSLVLTALSIPVVHVVLVLFGAPFLAQTSRTLLCAAHLAMLGLFPVIFTRGTDSGTWRALASGSLSQLDPAVGGLWGACVGAWLGAVPIPLDWDRAWQQWPVTVVVGTYLGHAVGRLLGGVVSQRRA